MCTVAIFQLKKNKDENALRYAVRGKKRERLIEREKCCVAHQRGHQGLPSISSTPKPLTYRDNVYLKTCCSKYFNVLFQQKKF